MSGCSTDSRTRRRYVRTATDDPPSASEDSKSDGYLGIISKVPRYEASYLQ